ncbi:uncharacterized protein CMU_027980 [Cryptosporidium muris RN66]|uniref:Atg6 BARA domain-containing protein n=1 Tax=Cryptosporidium muris (strain RN66) TaxID=441375 RepID=B6ABN6_CRYMR|nr:uncharacterized protein CMU_027980 [Cryptosporidium muris RN66]EEA05788.1 hypothetical protein, conserved [Cryptosporidium muris RN66]|eukprot:XP_002140137.1 hypothetical protein [Cryptosporidium muris RN66]
MFIFSNIKDKSKNKTEIRNDGDNEKSILRICCCCNIIFSVIISKDENDNLHSILDSFLDDEDECYSNLLENYFLQFMEVTLECYDNPKENIEESVCVECIDKLIMQFELNLNKTIDETKTLNLLIGNIDYSVEDISIIDSLIKDSLFDNEKDLPDKCNFNQCIHDNLDYFEILVKRQEKEIRLNNIFKLEYIQRLIDGTNSDIKFLQYHVDLLRKINIFNTTFYINQINGIGTINNLRLGLLDNSDENWREINGALGYTSLLLCCIAEKLNIEVTLNPYGNYSTITDRCIPEYLSNFVKEEYSILPLYGNTSANSNYNQCIKFDSAIKALLSNISNIAKYMNCSDKLPFIINYDMNTIDGVSYNLLFNDKQTWNNAMKMLLINLKYLIINLCEIDLQN